MIQRNQHNKNYDGLELITRGFDTFKGKLRAIDGNVCYQIKECGKKSASWYYKNMMDLIVNNTISYRLFLFSPILLPIFILIVIFKNIATRKSTVNI